MKILITGITGGIGSAIERRLARQHEIIGMGRPTEMPHQDIDWLICAHGSLNEDDLIGTFFANTISTIRLIQSTKCPVIVISSTAAFKGNDRYPIYSASKAAINTYCKSISGSRECYAVCPGPTDTKLWHELGIEGEPQDPDEVAKAVERVIAGDFHSGDPITVRNGVIDVVK